MDEISTLTAVNIEKAIKEKRIGVEELVKVYLNRIDKYDGKNGLNTIVELNNNILSEARKLDNVKTNRDSPMLGLLILVKDNIDVSGLHTTAGSLALQDNIATKDANIITNLKKNGALILGKTKWRKLVQQEQSKKLSQFDAVMFSGLSNGFNFDKN